MIFKPETEEMFIKLTRTEFLYEGLTGAEDKTFMRKELGKIKLDLDLHCTKEYHQAWSELYEYWKKMNSDLSLF